MNVFFDLIAQLLAVIYSIWNNYAWAITGLTLLIMLAVTPLTLKGTRSMMMMQQLMPEQKKLQARYKDDRQKYNEELLKFYKENNISPLGGCLPLFVQMPIFVVLYAVLRGLTRRTSPLGFNIGFTGGQLGTAVHHLTIPPTPVVPASGPHCTTPAATPGACFDPSYLRHSTTLYQNLSHTNVMQAMGMDLAQSATTAIKSGAVHALPYVLLIAVVAVTSWIQQKQIQGRTPPNSMPQQQQAIMKIMPFFLPIISITLPAGLVLYFAVSNLYRVGQQWFIGRNIYGPAMDAAGGSSGAAGGGSGKGKPSGGSSGGTGGAGGKGKPSGGGTTDGAGGAGAKPSGGGAAGARPKARRTSGSPNKTSGGDRLAKPTKTTSSGSTSNRGRSNAKPASGAGTTGGKDNGSGDATPAKPVLQPRARRNRKG